MYHLYGMLLTLFLYTRKELLATLVIIAPYLSLVSLRKSLSVNRVFDHLAYNSILHPAQHGFVKQRSTCTNLLESLNDWTLCVQTKQHISIVYIDFSKAFDVVSHNKLFARLYSYGIMVSTAVYYCGSKIFSLDVHTRQNQLLCLM